MKRALLGLIGIAALSGCATITRGTTETFAVQTDPPGAEARTSNGLGCPETPCEFIVPRKDPFILTLTKPGFRQRDITINTSMSGNGTVGMVGNVLFGGVIGVAVDASNGAGNDHTPNPVAVRLEPQGPVSPVIQQRGRRRSVPVS